MRTPAARRHPLLLGALILFALLAYSSSFASGFVFDNRILLQDPRITAATAENLRLIVTRDYWYSLTATGLYRPLATLSYLLNFAVLGDGAHPAGWHWINFLLHAVNLALVYALGLLLLEEVAPAFALAALWALHPVLTESVTNIIGRTDLMAAFGVLAGLLCHVQASSARGWRKPAWLAALLLVAAFGLFSKESAAVLPAVMLIYDLAFAGMPWRARAGGYLALLPLFACYFYIRSAVFSKLPPMHVNFGDNPLTGADFWTARLTAVKVIGMYLWRLLWPLELSADYSYNQIPLVTWRFHTWEDWKALVALAVCVAAALVALRCYRPRKAVFFFVGFFFLTLAPTSNIFLLIGTIMAERFLYLPSIAFVGCLVAAVYALSKLLPASWPAARLAAPALLGVIAIALAARTYARNFDWQDEKSLFTHDVRVSPASFKLHMSLAMSLNDGTAAGLDRAIVECESAAAILQGLPDQQQVDFAYINLGSYYRQKGDLFASHNPDGFLSNPQSEPWYRKSLATLLVAERLVRVTNEASRLQDLANGRKQAFEYGSYQLDRELGRTYSRLGEYTQSLASFARGRQRHTDPEFQVEMAAVMSAAGNPHQAAITLLEGIIVDPSYTKFASGLVEIYKKIDPRGCAVLGSGTSVSLNLECPLVHDDVCTASRNIAQAYRNMNQGTAANRTVQTAMTQLGCQAKFFQ